jgi:hypothetical protein
MDDQYIINRANEILAMLEAQIRDKNNPNPPIGDYVSVFLVKIQVRAIGAK